MRLPGQCVLILMFVASTHNGPILQTTTLHCQKPGVELHPVEFRRQGALVGFDQKLPAGAAGGECLFGGRVAPFEFGRVELELFFCLIKLGAGRGDDNAPAVFAELFKAQPLKCDARIGQAVRHGAGVGDRGAFDPDGDDEHPAPKERGPQIAAPGELSDLRPSDGLHTRIVAPKRVWVYSALRRFVLTGFNPIILACRND